MSLLFADDGASHGGLSLQGGVRFYTTGKKAPCFSRARMADRLLANQQGEME